MDMDTETMVDGALLLRGPPVLGPPRAAESPASPAAVEVAREERAATLAAHPPAGALLITIGVLLLHGPPQTGPLRPIAGALLMATAPGWEGGPAPAAGCPQAVESQASLAEESLARVVDINKHRSCVPLGKC